MKDDCDGTRQFFQSPSRAVGYRLPCRPSIALSHPANQACTRNLHHPKPPSTDQATRSSSVYLTAYSYTYALSVTITHCGASRYQYFLGYWW